MAYDMRRSPDRVDKVKSLNGRRHLILRLSAQGYGNIKISEILKERGITCTPQNVSDITNSEIGQEKLIDLRLDIEEKTVENVTNINQVIKDTAPYAMENVREAIQEGKVGTQAVDIKERLSLSKYVLQCEGHSPINKVSQKVDVNYGLEEHSLNFLKERSAQIKEEEKQKRELAMEIQEAIEV